MSQWDDEDPGLGDDDAVTSFTSIIDDIATTLNSLKQHIAEQNALVSADTWSGQSGNAFRDRAISVQSDLGTFAQWVYDTGNALATYGSAINTIDTNERLIRPQRTAARSQKASATQALLDASDPAEARTAAASLERATTKLSTCDAQWDQLIASRHHANTVLHQQLSNRPAVTFMHVGRVMLQNGYKPQTRMTHDDVVETLTDLCRDVRDGTIDIDDLEGLEALLRYASMSASVADALMQNLGGTDLTNILHQLDLLAESNPDTFDTLAGIQARLRETLSTASVDWDCETADAFNAELMQGTNAQLAVAYLYYDADHAPMSQTMSQSMADLIRTREVEDGRPWVWSGGVTCMGEQMPDFVTIVGSERTVLADPAHSVIISIAADPAVALAWLDENGNLDFWYDERDWKHASGATAPIILWESIQHTPGALLSPDCDLVLTEKLARMNAEIINNWKDSVLKGDTYISDRGLEFLSDLINTQMPYWIENSIFEVNGVNNGATYLEDGEIDWMGIIGPACLISDEALVDLLRLVAHSDAAAKNLVTGAEQLSHILINTAGSKTEIDGYGAALSKIAALHGLIDGAGIANELTDAQIKDAITQGWINFTTGTTGLLPGGMVTAGITEGANAFASHQWVDHYSTRLGDLMSKNEHTSDQKQLLEQQRSLQELANASIPAEILEQKKKGADGLAAEAAKSYDRNRFFGATS